FLECHDQIVLSFRFQQRQSNLVCLPQVFLLFAFTCGPACRHHHFVCGVSFRLRGQNGYSTFMEYEGSDWLMDEVVEESQGLTGCSPQRRQRYWMPHLLVAFPLGHKKFDP